MSVSVIDATSTGSTGTVMVSGNMPAFSAYASGGASLSSGTSTKVQFNTKVFDTANCFDATTNYRFTPNVAGYYQVNFGIGVNTAAVIQPAIYKNGSNFYSGQYGTAANIYNTTMSALIYMNGSTDYIEFYCYSNASTVVNTSSSNTWVQASMVRAA